MKKRISLLLLFVFSLLFLVACKETKFTVTFNNDGKLETVEVVEGNLVERPTDPTKEGFTFKGWYKDANFTKPWNWAEDKVEGDLTLYAKWEKDAGGEKPEVVKVNVTFNFNYSGSAAPSVVEVDKGSKVTAPTVPTRADFRFVGWSTSRTEYVAFDLDAVVNADVTVWAHWESTKTEHTVTLDLGHSDLTETHQVLDGELLEVENPTREGYLFLGWLLNGEAFELTTPITANITLVANWVEDANLEGTPITTAAQLVELFTTGGDGAYYLATNIDMADVAYEGSVGSGDSAVIFSGTLDGNGNRITNLNVTTPGNKSAAMFGILNGATIKNLIIMRSSIHVPGEGTGFVSYATYAGTTFENLTFINVSTSSTGNYAGLLYADNTGTAGEVAVTIKNIVVVNDADHEINAGRYAGGLVGYLRNSQVLDISNVYIKSTIKVPTNSTAGALVARVNNAAAVVNVDGVYFEGETFGTNYVGALVGEANVAATINLKNVVLSDVLVHTSGSTADLLVGRRHAELTLTTTNVVYANAKVFKGNTTPVEIPAAEATETVLDQSWFATQTLLDKTFFGYEEGKVVHLVDLGPKVAEKLTISKHSYNDLFVMGVDTELDLSSLEVSVAYSDGSSALLTADQYQVDKSGFNPATPGLQTITITHENLTGEIKVNVVEITSLTAYTYDVAALFLVNSVDLTKLVVQANLGDGSTLLLDSEDLVVTFDPTVVGVQNVTVSFKDTYTTTFPITIMATGLTAVDNKVTVVVDQALDVDSGTEISGVVHVKTVKEAINLIEKSKLLLDSDVKYIEVKDGTYFEKLKISAPNVVLRGQSQEGTIIDYNHGAGNQKPLGGVWGTQGSASVTISSSAKGFIATNLTISNSFDYYGAEFGDKQGVALVNEADQALFYKVKFLGLQDTLYAKNGRQWYYDVYVEGIVDFIFGNGGPAFFENSTIHAVARVGTSTNVVITAQKGVGSEGSKLLDYGYVFYKSKLTAGPETGVDLGRPWGPDAAVAFVDNTFGTFVSPHGWVDMSGNLPENARFFEYNNLIGETQYVSEKGTELTSEQAALYRNKDVVFATTNGQVAFTGEWDYLASLYLVAPELFATVSFDVDGVVTKELVLKGTPVAKPATDPGKENHSFDGWLLDTEPYNFETVVNADITLTAKFVALPVYEVKFMVDGTQYGEIQNVVEGKLASKPADPEKAGLTFVRWLLGTEEYVFSTPVTSDLELVAEFTDVPVEKVTVTFMSDGTQYDQVKVNKGTAVAAPATNPIKEGYNFIEWRLEGEGTAYNFDAPVNADITLGAYFESEYVPVGTPISTIDEFYAFATVNNEGEWYLANDLDFQGYEWKWVSNKNFSGVLDGNFKTISNLTIVSTGDRAGIWHSFRGSMKNINFSNIDISSTVSARAGLIAGEFTNNPITLTNIHIDGLVVAGANKNGVGGLAGYANQPVVADNITMKNATISSAEQAVGGLFGRVGEGKSEWDVSVTNVYMEKVSLTGPQRVGALFGESNGKQVLDTDGETVLENHIIVTIKNVVAVGMTIESTGANAGGLVGKYNPAVGLLGTATNVFFEGTIAGTSYGLVVDDKKFETVTNYWYKGSTAAGTGQNTENLLDAASVQDQAWWDTNLAEFSTNNLWVYDATLNVYKLK